MTRDTALFDDVSAAPAFPVLEQGILDHWRAADIQKKAMARSKPGKAPYVFYEGPPTANGRPGIHHVSARTVKDVYCRFKTMQGHQVDRRAGWDTHGLPVELEVEKQIGSKGKQDIEKYGIAAFNEKCRDSVFTYIKDWVSLTERIGFWVDFDRAYVTYHNSYIESEWWILKNLWDRGLFYKDYKTTMHCPRCNTSLADHEVSLGMKEDVDDPSTWVKFIADSAELKKRGVGAAGETRDVNLLAWTTTPWTLGANVAICVAPETQYALVEAPPFWNAPADAAKELYIVASVLAPTIFAEGTFNIVSEFSEERLAGVGYAPVLRGQEPAELGSALRTVLVDSHVDITAGSGVLHTATAYGDLEMGETHGLPVLFSAGRDGLMLPDVKAPDAAEGPGPYTGVFFKDADKQIVRDLKQRGRIFRSDRIKHAYPHCWRDDTPLLFLAKTSWYLRTTAVKDRLIANNQAINWQPEHVRDGRFGRWLENNIDWSISRERFWGCPLPIWQSEDGESFECIGSIEQLSKLVGRDLKDLDLHRPYVDEITFQKDGKTFRRVTDTVDVWFDSGAMPYAQWHYPFENVEAFEKQFPADYISEAMDQTRGWFYSLHAIAALLTYAGDAKTPAGPLAKLAPNSPAFRNVVVMGFINDEHDKKMSKSRGNTVDPWSVLNKEGCDPLRWYILNAAAPGKNLAFKRDDIAKQQMPVFLTLWNVYSFFVSYANLSKPDLSRKLSLADRPEIDRWLEAKRNKLIADVTTALEDYDAAEATRLIAEFVDRDLSNWYVRRNRRRFWGRVDEGEAESAFVALYEALLTTVKLMAPMAPFFSEALYRNLAKHQPGGAAESVHLDDWPEADVAAIDETLIVSMSLVLNTVYLGRSARAKSNLKTRQPLRTAFVRVPDAAGLAVVEANAQLIAEELNVREVKAMGPEEEAAFVSYSLRPNLAAVGKRLKSKLGALKAVLADEKQVAKIVESVIAKKAVTLDLGGDPETLAPEDFLLDATDRGGFATSVENGLLVALETALDAELVEEGRLREALRQLQDARKKAQFAVSDRIVLALSGSGAEAFAAKYAETLGRELLAEKVIVGELADAELVEVLDLDDMEMTAALRRV
ncbi:MAG: isoleucine--tRNA ligase [Hyphomonadaceae bacterium]|nr:isoleucine--tRNA ligase [Hyphomonadaceae bacterium]